MMIEHKITAELQRQTANVRLPDDLMGRIKRAAAKPVGSSLWASLMKRKAVAAAAAALLILPLAGFATKQIWVAHPNPPGTVYAATRPLKFMVVAEIAAALDFKLKLPAYLPDGMTLHNANLAGDSTGADAKFRVAGIDYEGEGRLTVEEWRAEKAAAFPPAHSFPQVLDTEPWHKTLSTVTVKVGDVEGHMVSYLLSGMGFNRVYWNENGVNYAVDAYAQLPEPELLKVARSLR